VLPIHLAVTVSDLRVFENFSTPSGSTWSTGGRIQADDCNVDGASLPISRATLIGRTDITRNRALAASLT